MLDGNNLTSMTVTVSTEVSGQAINIANVNEVPTNGSKDLSPTFYRIGLRPTHGFYFIKGTLLDKIAITQL